jgi:hypothetical protein
MLSLDESRINSKIQASLGVQHIRVQIQQAEAEIEQAETALADLPASLQREMLAKHYTALGKLRLREDELIAQARRTAEAELRAERVDSLRIEAAPLLERASKNLDSMRSDLAKVAAIEREARVNGGSVMTEAFDKAVIDYFIPRLVFEKSRGTWLLKR